MVIGAPSADQNGDYLAGETYVVFGAGGAADLDLGDAPDPTYPTLLASDGARHIMDDGATEITSRIMRSATLSSESIFSTSLAWAGERWAALQRVARRSTPPRPAEAPRRTRRLSPSRVSPF